MAKTKNHRATLASLQKGGLSVVPGRLYVYQEWLPRHPQSLEALHRKLAVFRGSLADEIARARDEG